MTLDNFTKKNINLLSESCRAKHADFKAEHYITLPSKLTEIYILTHVSITFKDGALNRS